ncbi:MAG TPA: hypothetical protein VH042_07375 [Solirubrobacterales bacterium]|nr:hypothetical protein [Solirubrobacterales bacterium]
MRGIVIAFPLTLGAIAVVAAAAGHGDPPPPRPVATVTSGSFDLANSRGDMPIFEASDIGPGDGASGTVTIANEGDEAGELTLSQHDVDDTPGAGGGLLSRRMSMRIREVGDPAKSKSVYDGALAPMPALELGPLEPGQSRVFEFDAALPDGGTPTGAAIGDNAFQGAALSVGYSWTATELPPAPPVAPRPTTSETGSPGASTSTPRNAQLTILRIRAAIWHRRLVLWAYCGPGTCQVLVRLRFKAHRLPGSRGKALGSVRRERLIAGSQRLVFKLSPKLRRALRVAAEKHARATASVFLVLRDREAEPATARGAVRLRHLQPGVRHGRR